MDPTDHRKSCQRSKQRDASLVAGRWQQNFAVSRATLEDRVGGKVSAALEKNSPIGSVRSAVPNARLAQKLEDL